ncbi:MAG: succinate dehydrogenase, hydrophobic membrane anchor protein [Pseudomonadota bacterium]
MTGLSAWLVQRVSAVCMLLITLFVLVHFLVDPPGSYLAWHGWVMSPGISVLTLVFFAALLSHMWVGVRDVVMDYIQPIAYRVPVLAVLGVSLIAMAGWILRIVLIGRS